MNGKSQSESLNVKKAVLEQKAYFYAKVYKEID